MNEFLTQFFLAPMLNALLVLYGLLGENFGLAIIAFTILVRLAMLPLTLKQLNQSKRMSSLQPEMAKLRDKYKNDQAKMSSETMALYRQAGVNPIGCLGPMVIQFPIWIGLYSAIYAVMPANAGRLVPEGVLHLSELLYQIPFFGSIFADVPLNRGFLWLDLSAPDPFYILAILVGVSMFIQQKMSINPDLPMDPQQASMQRTMQTIMPLMFGFFTISVASGLGVYWLVSNIISIAMQYFVTGWGSLKGYNPFESLMSIGSMFGLGRRPQPALATAGGRRNGGSASSGRLANGAKPGLPSNGTDPGDDADAEDTGAAQSARARRRSNARGRNKRKNG